MSIEYRTGDILKCDARTLVNPVNLAGVMGAGLAKKFSDKYPGLSYSFRTWCRDRKGPRKKSMPLLYLFRVNNDKLIINLPTKFHWKGDADTELISVALDEFSDRMPKMKSPIAIPALGCGIGNLKWSEIEKLILYKLSEGGKGEKALYGKTVYLFPPQSF